MSPQLLDKQTPGGSDDVIYTPADPAMATAPRACLGCYLILTEKDLVDALSATLGAGAAQALINELRAGGLYRELQRVSQGTRSDRIAAIAAAYHAQVVHAAAAEAAATERMEAQAAARDSAEQYAFESAQVTEEVAAATAQAWRDFAVRAMQTSNSAPFDRRQDIGTAFSGPRYQKGGHKNDGELRPWNLVDEVVVAGHIDEIAPDDDGNLRVEAEHAVKSDGTTLFIDRLTHMRDGTIEVREVFSGEGQASSKIDQVARYGALIERDFPGHKVELVLHTTNSFDERLVRDAAAAGVRIVH